MAQVQANAKRGSIFGAHGMYIPLYVLTRPPRPFMEGSETNYRENPWSLVVEDESPSNWHPLSQKTSFAPDG